MLQRFLVMDKSMLKLAEQIQHKQWEGVKLNIYKQKKAWCFIGAGRLFFICSKAEDALEEKDFLRVYDLYQLHVEQFIEF